MKNAQVYDENYKEPLGLDDNGQIKLSHDHTDIQKMIDRGMIKPSAYSPSPKLAVNVSPLEEKMQAA